jgi:hypothetical protein
MSVSSPLKGDVLFQGPGAKFSLGALESAIAEDMDSIRNFSWKAVHN